MKVLSYPLESGPLQAWWYCAVVSIVLASALTVRKQTAGLVCTPSLDVRKFLRLELLQCTVPSTPLSGLLVLCPVEYRKPRIHAIAEPQNHNRTVRSQIHLPTIPNCSQRNRDLHWYCPSWMPSHLMKEKKCSPV